MKKSVKIRVSEHSVEIVNAYLFAEDVHDLLREDYVGLVSCKSEFLGSAGYYCISTWTDGSVYHYRMIDGRKERKCGDLDIRRLWVLVLRWDDDKYPNTFMFHEDPDRPIKEDLDDPLGIPSDLVSALQEIPADQW